MDDMLFEELLESVQEMKAIQKGEQLPHRVTLYEHGNRLQLSGEAFQSSNALLSEPDPIRIRATLGLSQSQFADLIGVSKRTLAHWEHGTQKPRGAARVLLLMAQKHPETFLQLAS
jgi:putative transcriptional regulator